MSENSDKMVIVCNSDTAGVMPTMIMGASGVGIGDEVLVFFCPGGSKVLLKGELEKFRGKKGLPDPVELYDTILQEGGRIILCELPNPEEPVHHPAGFVAMHHAELGHAHGELTIGVLGRLVHQASAGAIHLLDRIADPVDLAEVHVLLVVVPVSTSVPKLLVENNRGPYLTIAVFVVLVAQEINYLIPYDCPFAVYEGKARTCLVETKQV